MRPGKTNLTLHTFIIAYVITSISVFANGPSSSSSVNFAIRCLLSITTRLRHLPPSRRHTLHRLNHHCRRPTFLPSSTSIQPVDARSSSFLFETDDHWFAHHLGHSTSPPSFLHHRRSFSSSMCRTLYYHQHESTYLLDMYSDGARTVLRLLGRQGPPRGVSSRGTYYWGAYFSSCCSLLPMLLSSCHFYIFSGSCITFS